MLKKHLRYQYQLPDDINIFGYTIEENHRLKKLLKNEPGLEVDDILRENNLNKSSCLEIVQSLGIELPAMYKLLYNNNNCIGCPKGGMGYWNKIRIDFPDTFGEMAKLERELKFAINKDKKERIFLDELQPDRGDFKIDQPGPCGFICQQFNKKIEEVVQ
ncbi:MAG TPA: hypothetical protein VHO03_17230 [Ignavibacteriales bacterium]|nr:hypothetical protein [Ignavibacteriales bacterium]